MKGAVQHLFWLIGSLEKLNSDRKQKLYGRRCEVSFDNETKADTLDVFAAGRVGLPAMDPNTRTIVIALFILAAIFALAMGGQYLR